MKKACKVVCVLAVVNLLPLLSFLLFWLLRRSYTEPPPGPVEFVFFYFWPLGHILLSFLLLELALITTLIILRRKSKKENPPCPVNPS